jgi:alpha-tubulin suppressor-like RCC1 family protein
MALDASGNVWDWGHGGFGELGTGQRKNSPKNAVEAIGPTDVVSIGEGEAFAAAVDSSGNLWTWGHNSFHQLCFNHKRSTSVPTEVKGVDALAVSGGANHLLVLLANGTVDACGQDSFGDLGDGRVKPSGGPVPVQKLTNVIQISSGNLFSAALESDGSVWTWGRNNLGQLGIGSTTNQDVPQRVTLPAPAVQIYAGGDYGYDGHMAALLSNGELMEWGSDEWGQLGNGLVATSFTTPQQVSIPAGVTFTSIAAGGRDSFAIDSGGGLWAWGTQNDGDLGDGVRGSGAVLTPELVGHGFTQISAVSNEAVGLS